MVQSRTSGYCSTTPRLMASISACAISILTPGLRRPMTLITWLRRFSRDGSMTIGTQRSPPVSRFISGPITPTSV